MWNLEMCPCEGPVGHYGQYGMDIGKDNKALISSALASWPCGDHFYRAGKISCETYIMGDILLQRVYLYNVH